MAFSREAPKELGLIDALFDRFGDDLATEGYQAKQGQIIDASIVPVPIQRNSREENCRIKDGEILEAWSDAKGEQKNVDRRWTKKNAKSYFRQKNHINVEGGLSAGDAINDSAALTAVFTSMQDFVSWSDTEFAPNPNKAWNFSTDICLPQESRARTRPSSACSGSSAGSPRTVNVQPGTCGSTSATNSCA